MTHFKPNSNLSHYSMAHAHCHFCFLIIWRIVELLLPLPCLQPAPLPLVKMLTGDFFRLFIVDSLFVHLFHHRWQVLFPHLQNRIQQRVFDGVEFPNVDFGKLVLEGVHVWEVARRHLLGGGWCD